VELGGFGKLHAPFLTERRTRGLVQRCVAGNPGSGLGSRLAAGPPGLATIAILQSFLSQLAIGKSAAPNEQKIKPTESISISRSFHA
jgi:hypothetical protein